MSEKIKYTDEPLGNLKVVPDFLPRPEELVVREEGVKVTIAMVRTIPKCPVFWCYRETEMAIRYMSCGAFPKDTRSQRLS